MGMGVEGDVLCLTNTCRVSPAVLPDFVHVHQPPFIVFEQTRVPANYVSSSLKMAVGYKCIHV